MANYLPQADSGGNCCDCPTRTNPCDSCSKILYIQFQVITHESCPQEYPFFKIGGTDLNTGPFVEVTRTNTGNPVTSGFLFLYENFPAITLTNAGNGTFPPEAWFTVDLKIDFSGATPVVTPRIDGTAYATFNCTTGLPIGHFYLGNAIGTGFQTYPSDRQLDNLKLGTTDYGSSELFSADFASNIIPPFDNIVQSTPDPSVTLDSGTLRVKNGLLCTPPITPLCTDPAWLLCPPGSACPDPQIACSVPCDFLCAGSGAYAHKVFSFP